MKSAPINDDEWEQMELMLRRLLPADTLAEWEARATKLGVKPLDVIDEVGERAMRKSPACREEMIEIAQAISKARELGIEPLWPESFEDRIVVASLLSLKFGDSFPDYLLELEGPKMDIVEFFCKKEGISYEEFMRRAIGGFHSQVKRG
jgi:hypothetical protein